MIDFCRMQETGMAKKARKKPTDPVQFPLRMLESLGGRLEASALKKGHSVNSEIIHRLELTFTRELQEFEQAEAIRASLGDQMNEAFAVLMRKWIEEEFKRRRIGSK
jgi:hypothetical protein